jgi:hypothetical protein
MLVGLPEGRELADFQTALGSPVAEIRSLSLLSSAHDLSKSAGASPTALLRLVDTLSPDPAQGQFIKDRFLSAAAESVGSMSIALSAALKSGPPIPSRRCVLAGQCASDARSSLATP